MPGMLLEENDILEVGSVPQHFLAVSNNCGSIEGFGGGGGGGSREIGIRIISKTGVRSSRAQEQLLWDRNSWETQGEVQELVACIASSGMGRHDSKLVPTSQ